MSSSWLLPAPVLPLLWWALGGCHLSESSRRSRVRPSGQQHTRAVPGANPNPSPFVFWIITRPSYPFRDSQSGACSRFQSFACPRNHNHVLPEAAGLFSQAPRLLVACGATKELRQFWALNHLNSIVIDSQLPHNSSILLNQWWVKVAGGNIFWVAAGRAHLKQGSKSWVPHCQRDADKLEEIRKKSHKND